MRKYLARWVPVTVGAALLLAGCGGAASSTGGTATTGPVATKGAASGNPLLTAYQKTVAAKTAGMSLVESVNGATGGPVTVTANGQIDFASGDASLSMTVPSAGAVQLVLVKPTLYLQLPSSLGSILPAGKSWVSLNLDSASTSALGSSFSQLSGSADLSSQGLAYLQGISTDGVHTIGPDTVRGVATTEYSATIDLTKAVPRGDAAAQAALQKLRDSTGLSTVPIKVWIDAQGQVRRVVVQQALTVGGKSVTADVTIEYFDFGAPVAVAPPPADQTVDLSSLFGGSAA